MKAFKRVYNMTVPYSPFLREEPLGPILATAPPGPKSQRLLELTSKFSQDKDTIKVFIDLSKSIGNYIADPDGNYILDTFSHIGSLPIGYNHTDFELVIFNQATQSPDYLHYLAQRPTAHFPHKDLPKLITDTLMPIAPSSTDEVYLTCGCGTSANEIAFKLAFEHFAKLFPSKKDPIILSFNGAFHGRLFGTLTTTRSKAVHKVAVPSFGWPGARFPDIKHPYYLNEAYNREQEDLALAELEKQLESLSVAGVILEPILAEGGDKLASANFYIGVQNLCKKHGALFIVDEVQTGGGATGRFWAHEHWGPRFDADIVTFAKKMQVSGLFYKSHLQSRNPELMFNPYNTDVLRLLNFQIIHRIMKVDRLIRNSEQAGHALRTGLQQLSERLPISNVRGLGSFLAYDLPTPALANTLVHKMLKYGVNVGLCGNQSVRVRPSLVFQQKHAQVYLERLEIALQGLYN